MDGLKFQEWRENFIAQVDKLPIENLSFLHGRKLNEFYMLSVDHVGGTLCLELKNKEELPKEIQEHLKEILEMTKPEDSV